MAAVARAKCSANLEVCRPPEVQWKPPLRQAAVPLAEMRAQPNLCELPKKKTKFFERNFISLRFGNCMWFDKK
jgi:hypothetical protein